MLRCARFISLAIVTSLCLGYPVQAWNSAGHRIIADITYDLLDEGTRAKAVALIKASPRFNEDFVGRMPAEVASLPDDIKDRWHFQQSAVWADVIRGNKQYDKPTWHYINKPHFLSELDEQALKDKNGVAQSTVLSDKIDPGVDPQELNAVQAVQMCLARIASPNTPKEKKAVYFLWVMHIVTDLHQPLHSTSLYSRGRFSAPGGDRGGNSIRTQSGNLHALWDGLLGGNGASLNNIRGRAQKIVGEAVLKKLGEDSASKIDPVVWVNEGHAICKEFVYCQLILDEVRNKEATPGTSLAAVELPAEYMTKGGRIAEERAVQAAYRLATLLKKQLN
jgi:hypothetical protein